MDFRRLVLIFPATFLILTACANTAHKPVPEALYFKNFALAICIASSFSDAEIKNDGQQSASGYREMGQVGLDAYEELRGLVKKWQNKNYPTLKGPQVRMPKCFDLYNSVELEELYKKHTPCGKPNEWLDEEYYKQNCGL